MLNPKIENAINAQINAELYSSYLYLSMSAHFQSKNLPGMAHWMQLQAQEELGHAMRMFAFVNDRGGRVTLKPIEGPRTDWASPREVFEHVFEHECKVTGLINDLASLALAEKDHATGIFLQWFVTEQIEEEANAVAIVEKLKLVGDSGVPLYMLDKELAQRVASPTPPAGE